MNKYEVVERILRIKGPYGSKKDILEGYVVIDTETDMAASALISDKDEAKHKAYNLNRLTMEGKINV